MVARMKHSTRNILASVLFIGACGRTELLVPTVGLAEPFCGNGFAESGEFCDDGNATSQDACLTTCMFARCGDGIVHTAVEACDDGNDIPNDGCTLDCALSTCGNGIVELDEVCDDGNEIDSDDCPSRCLPAVCGDGFVHAGVEECDGGVFNSDRPPFFLVQGSLVRPITPVTRNQSFVDFYGYASASGHTGFEGVGLSSLFLYRDSNPYGAFGLVTLHGSDKMGDSEQQPPSVVKQSFTGLPTNAFVAVSDDDNKKGEFVQTGPSTAAGDWEFKNNSDGGAIAGFPAPGAFVIEVTSEFFAGITRWEFIDGTGERIPLQLDLPAKIISTNVPSPCHTDCTIPRCGDGILDAGELCDDGNLVSGDDCPANCILAP